MRRGAHIREANLKDVALRIWDKFRDWTIVQRLVDKIKLYLKTHNPADDLTLQESKQVWGDKDYGAVLPLSNKRKVDIEWTPHAEYRSDLRDVPAEKVNEGIETWLHNHLMEKGPDAKKVKMNLPGTGTAVVDYSLMSNPARAEVVTVWASEGDSRYSKIAMRVEAALLEDYGMANGLARLIKADMEAIIRATKKGDVDTVRAYAGRLHTGYLTKLATRRIPDELREKYAKVTYKIGFESSWNDYWGETAYRPDGSLIIAVYNVGIAERILMMSNPAERKANLEKLIRDMSRYELTMRHEVTHALRDAQTGSIGEYVDRMMRDNQVAEFYNHHGHQQLDFEVDAVINAMAKLKKKKWKIWNTLTMADIEKIMVGMRFPDKYTEADTWKMWVRRLTREGLLTDAMRAEWGVKSPLEKAAALLERIPRGKDALPTLWYENEKGDRVVPDFSTGDVEMPEGFKYQVSRFPNQLTTSWLSCVTQEDVAKCEHPADWVEVDHGIIDSMEGRRCKKCGGYQSKQKGEEWPEKWEAYGSRPMMSGNAGWNEDLVLALVSKGFKLSEAIIVAAESCEACMNVLAHECGLDWGYAHGSDDWKKCGTKCGFCCNGGTIV